MPITQRGQSFQVAVNHKGKRYRRQFPSHLEAQQWELDTKLKLAKGEAPDMGEASSSNSYQPTTVGKLIEYMIAHHWTGTKGEKAATINANHIVRLVGADTPLRQVSSHTINLAIAALKAEGYPDSTINKKVSTLRTAMKYAVEQRWLDHVPAMKFFKPGEGRIRVFSLQEEADQLAWCIQHAEYELHDFIVVSYDTGLRQEETLTLKARNIRAMPGAVTIWGKRTELDNGTKAANSRFIPLTPRAQEVLERRCPEGMGTLFNLNKDRLRHRWDAMRDALGFKDDPEYVPHAMRHTFCSRLVNDHDRPLTIVQLLAGHKRLETTAKYVHHDKDALFRAIGMLASPVDNVYTPATTRPGAVPHDTVACHTGDVVGSIDPAAPAKVLNYQRKSA